MPWLCALIGLIAWCLGAWIHGYPLGISVFLWAPLVLVPLTLDILKDSLPPMLGRWIIMGQLPAASMLLTLSPLLSWPWLLLTVLVALAGMVRLANHRLTSIPELGVSMGMVYLVVGGVWMMLARYGLQPLGFSDAIVQATATHFHYAGFILPVLAGLAAKELTDRQAQAAVLGGIVGVPLVATGITLAALGIAWVEWLAAWFMSAAGILLAVQQIRLGLRSAGLMQRGLFLLSGSALGIGIALAAAYALGNCLQANWLDIPAMIRTHGLINALGFALPGLLAWLSAARGPCRPWPGLPPRPAGPW